LEAVARELYEALKNRSWRYTVEERYAEACDLHQNIEKGLHFKLFIHAIK